MSNEKKNFYSHPSKTTLFLVSVFWVIVVFLIAFNIIEYYKPSFGLGLFLLFLLGIANVFVRKIFINYLTNKQTAAKT